MIRKLLSKIPAVRKNQEEIERTFEDLEVAKSEVAATNSNIHLVNEILDRAEYFGYHNHITHRVMEGLRGNGAVS